MEKIKRIISGIRRFAAQRESWIIGTLFMLAIWVIGMLMRYKLFPYHTPDMDFYLSSWYHYLAEHGGFAAVGDEFGDYTPAYYYIMAALTYFDFDFASAIKLVSTAFDLILSLFVMKIVQLREPAHSPLPLIAYAVTFCLPTVFLNSAAWGQCDAIYVTLLVAALYFILRGNDRAAMIMVGLSVAFKLQAVFFMPLVGILLIRKKIRWRSLLWIPGVYVLSIIPATIAGGDFKRLLTVYFRQSEQYPFLTMKLPNVYSIWGQSEIQVLGSAGIFFAGICVITFMYFYITRKKLEITRASVICLATLSAFLVPYVLPYMHERYMYLMEIMFVIFAFSNPKKIWLIFTTQFVSVKCLSIYLFAQEEPKTTELWLLALITMFHAAVVVYTLHKEIEPSDAKPLVMKYEKKQDEAPAAAPQETAEQTP